MDTSVHISRAVLCGCLLQVPYFLALITVSAETTDYRRIVFHSDTDVLQVTRLLQAAPCRRLCVPDMIICRTTIVTNFPLFLYITEDCNV